MRLRPSAAERWVNCALSPSLEAPFADEEAGPAAAEGTAAHWYLSETLLGKTVPAGVIAPNDVEVTAEMIRDCRIYLKVVEEGVARAGSDAYRGVEETLPMAYSTSDSGTTDAYIVNADKTHLQVFDFKYGYRPVRAKDNWQGVAYCSAIAEHHELSSSCIVDFTIVQPRDFSQSVKPWRTTVGNLQHKLGIMQRAAENAHKPNPEATTGKHCLYCKGRAQCPASRAMAGALVDWSLAETPSDLSDEAIGAELDVLEAASGRIAARLQALRALAENKVRSGQRIPGWALQPALTREAWTVPDTEVFALGEVFGVDLFAKQRPVTPKQARDAGIPAEVIQGYAGRPSKMELARVRPDDVFN